MIRLLMLLLMLPLDMLADQVLSRDERIVALTILGEARGEGEKGMYAVACVIRMRAVERELSSAKVCLEPWQFSVWNAGKGKVKKETELYFLWKSPNKMYARELAKKVCSRAELDQKITGGANHYCTVKANPYWTKGKKPTKIIGNHKFYKL